MCSSYYFIISCLFFNVLAGTRTRQRIRQYVLSRIKPENTHVPPLHNFLCWWIYSFLAVGIFDIEVPKELWGRGQSLERRNVKRPIFQNFKITYIKTTKYKLFDSFISELIFLLFTNYFQNLMIFQNVKYWFCGWGSKFRKVKF